MTPFDISRWLHRFVFFSLFCQSAGDLSALGGGCQRVEHRRDERLRHRELFFTSQHQIKEKGGRRTPDATARTGEAKPPIIARTQRARPARRGSGDRGPPFDDGNKLQARQMDIGEGETSGVETMGTLSEEDASELMTMMAELGAMTSTPPPQTAPPWRPFRSNPNTTTRRPFHQREGTRNPVPDFIDGLPEFIVGRGERDVQDRFNRDKALSDPPESLEQQNGEEDGGPYELQDEAEESEEEPMGPTANPVEGQLDRPTQALTSEGLVAPLAPPGDAEPMTTGSPSVSADQQAPNSPSQTPSRLEVSDTGSPLVPSDAAGPAATPTAQPLETVSFLAPSDPAAQDSQIETPTTEPLVDFAAPSMQPEVAAPEGPLPSSDNDDQGGSPPTTTTNSTPVNAAADGQTPINSTTMSAIPRSTTPSPSAVAAGTSMPTAGAPASDEGTPAAAGKTTGASPGMSPIMAPLKMVANTIHKTPTSTFSDCFGNHHRQDIMIGLDLQLLFEGGIFLTCDSVEENLILRTMQETLNVMFPHVAVDWGPGTADFGLFRFDSQQFLFNTNPISMIGLQRRFPPISRRRQQGYPPSVNQFRPLGSSNSNSPRRGNKMRPTSQRGDGGNIVPSLSQFQAIPHRTGPARGMGYRRRLKSNNKCPPRPTTCPSAATACLFACGVASTTTPVNYCGKSASTESWKLLALDVAHSLRTLNLQCLGSTTELLKAKLNVY